MRVEHVRPARACTACQARCDVPDLVPGCRGRPLQETSAQPQGCDAVPGSRLESALVCNLLSGKVGAGAGRCTTCCRGGSATATASSCAARASSTSSPAPRHPSATALSPIPPPPSTRRPASTLHSSAATRRSVWATSSAASAAAPAENRARRIPRCRATDAARGL
jgi:hypothetical protein